MIQSILAVLVVLTCAVDPIFAQAGKTKTFRAGAYAMDITPPKLPISVNGGMQDRMINAVNDRLHARCLVLDDGATKIAIVVCDSCMIPREIIDEAREWASKTTGIPSANILVSATHTHSAPTVSGVFQSDPNPEYQKFLTQRIAKGIDLAHLNLEPAHVGWAVGSAPDQVFNRRWKLKEGTVPADPFGRTTDTVKMNPGYLNPNLVEPAGPTDPEVRFLSLRTPKGRPIALLANYSLHYVGGVGDLSADYFGAFAERIKSLLDVDKADPPFVGIMSNGTSGDINNVNFKAMPPKRERYEQIRVVADSVARAVLKAHQTMKHLEWVSLASAQKEIELGVRLPSASDLKQAREILDNAKAKGKGLKTLPEIYARETVLLADYPKTVKVRLQAIRIGALGIVSSPCETFVEIGLEIKKKSPLKHTFTIELANGYNGYLPTPEQHKKGGYETWRARSSYLEVNAATAITATLLDLLKEVTVR
jgi:neutral ceramidase